MCILWGSIGIGGSSGLQSTLHAITDFPEFMPGWQRWDGRALHPDAEGVMRPFRELWVRGRPPRALTAAIRLVRLGQKAWRVGTAEPGLSWGESAGSGGGFGLGRIGWRRGLGKAASPHASLSAGRSGRPWAMASGSGERGCCLRDAVDAELLVDGKDFAAEAGELGGVPGGSGEDAEAGEEDCVRCAEVLRQPACEQGAERHHAGKGEGVPAHDAAAAFFGNDGLNDGVGAGEALHHAEAGDQKAEHGERKCVGEGEADQRQAKEGGGDQEVFGEAADIFAGGEIEGRGEGADAGGRGEQAEGVRSAVEDAGRKDGQKRDERHAHQRADGKQEQDGANGLKSADILEALAQLLQHGIAALRAGLRGGEAHQQQRGDDGEVGDAVDQEAGAFAGTCDDEAGNSGADEAGGVDQRGVEGDGVAQVVFGAADHLDHEALAAGHVEGVDETLQGGEGEDFVDCDTVREGEGGKRERLPSAEDLRGDKQLLAIETIHPDAGKGRQKRGADLRRKPYQAEQKGGAGEAVRQPGKR